MTSERFTYGDDPSQWADLYLPDGTSRGVVVVIHGGFWLAQYDATLGAPLAESLAREGWTAWNLEYRRTGNGGGLPETFDDVAAGIDRLAQVDGVDTTTVVTLGHSAGGHLAVWAGARGRFARWQPVQVPITAAISQAGVLDLTAASEQGLGGGAVERFLGLPPSAEYDEIDPRRQIPLEIPVWCVHGSDDTIVPLSQSTGYVDAATAAGAGAGAGAGNGATMVEVEGDHFVVIDPNTEAWKQTLGILSAL